MPNNLRHVFFIYKTKQMLVKPTYTRTLIQILACKHLAIATKYINHLTKVLMINVCTDFLQTCTTPETHTAKRLYCRCQRNRLQLLTICKCEVANLLDSLQKSNTRQSRITKCLVTNFYHRYVCVLIADTAPHFDVRQPVLQRLRYALLDLVNCLADFLQKALSFNFRTCSSKKYYCYTN